VMRSNPSESSSFWGAEFQSTEVKFLFLLVFDFTFTPLISGKLYGSLGV
jgi:hypothetical protein